MTILSQFSFKSLLITGLFSLAATIANGQSVISRAYHNTVARYNLYYNSKTLVEDARVKAAEAHKNNFKEVIDIFPYSDEAQLKGNAPNMDEVLKKLSTIIEKHSKSKWVDDSYLMMGKAQFFKGDFYAAIEVFEYVNSTYKGKPLTYEVDLWILKCYLMLNNIEDAEALYTKLKNQVNFPAKLKPELKLAGATIFIREKKYTSAIKLLEEVRPLIKKKEQKIRVNFAMGQIYQLLNMQDKSIERFSKVAKMNPPYDFAFNARLSMARAINPKNKSEIKQAKNSMKRMLRDDKNIDYFDRIYYELGNLEIIDKNPAEALVNYKLSLASKTSDATQKSNTYLAVAEIYFKSQNYEYAQLYYDSAARAISPEHPDYKVITQRNEILNDLIKHLVIIRTQDSLLKLSENEKLREKTIDKLIRAEKEKQILDKNKEENKAFISGTLPGQAGANAGSSTFPFYNQAARNKGYSDFLRIWGSRSLKDNWAFSSLQTIGNTDPSKDPDNSKDSDSSKVVENTLMLNAPEERKKYYEFIPVTKAQKDKARYSMWESYIMAANIYYQQLNEPEKAMKLLQELLSKYPGNSFEANAWYLLAKINKDKGNMAKWSE
ncbi:MAG: tetratricopeptide repeat protein, partial [Bacteroidia bacterium]|nr:tetratricopeptide repeat protein [Bacteroidia bacterium]